MAEELGSRLAQSVRNTISNPHAGGWTCRSSFQVAFPSLALAGSLISSELLLFLSFGPSVCLVPPRVKPASAGPGGAAACPGPLAPGPTSLPPPFSVSCFQARPAWEGGTSPTNRAGRARRSRSLLPGLQGHLSDEDLGDKDCALSALKFPPTPLASQRGRPP